MAHEFSSRPGHCRIVASGRDDPAGLGRRKVEIGPTILRMASFLRPLRVWYLVSPGPCAATTYRRCISAGTCVAAFRRARHLRRAEEHHEFLEPSAYVRASGRGAGLALVRPA